jgi:hypothetical protein
MVRNIPSRSLEQERFFFGGGGCKPRAHCCKIMLLIVINFNGFKLEAKLLVDLHVTWKHNGNYCTTAKFYHKIQFRCKSICKRHYFEQGRESNWYFLHGAQVQSSKLSNAFLQTSFSSKTESYLNSPLITAWQLSGNAIWPQFPSASVSTGVGRTRRGLWESYRRVRRSSWLPNLRSVISKEVKMRIQMGGKTYFRNVLSGLVCTLSGFIFIHCTHERILSRHWSALHRITHYVFVLRQL